MMVLINGSTIMQGIKTDKEVLTQFYLLMIKVFLANQRTVYR
jgi:hypothetical protein